MPTQALAVLFSMLLCAAAHGQAFTTVGEKDSASSRGSNVEKAPSRPPNTSPPAQAPSRIDATGDASATGDRPFSGLSRTHVIIIGSCIAVAVAAAVIIGIVIRRRRLARAQCVQASPQIVIGSAQLYSPPAASAPPLHDDSTSFEFAKPYVAEVQNQMPLQ